MKVSRELVLALAISMVLVGCQNTAEGAKVDARDNSINASNALKEGIDNGANIAKNAEVDAKKMGENLGAATTLTPRIKNAFNAEPKLNSDENMIDVDSTKDKVSLNGHVASQELKSLAGKIAKDEMTKAKAEQKLVNNLVVQAPAKASN